jgi:hypothetical protein
MEIFKALHILSMFAMVTVFASGAFLYAFATMRRDVPALATFHRTARTARLPLIGLGALIAGIAFGLLTAATGGLDFFVGWLVAAYVLGPAPGERRACRAPGDRAGGPCHRSR